ncbi:hypothetical protein [Tardiphaga sp.]|uniref:hypothetical protein n=1 Tax=Tardiphaga sp. TaxID=1926292 RepID=UPI0026228AB3|nr:hypothetical protein [Tardiphaga sp.]
MAKWSDSILTPQELSLIKARYFRSILNVAKPTEEASALRLIGSLANDAQTADAPPDLAAAELAALEAVRRLAESMHTREHNLVAAWNGATRAVQHWLGLLGDQPQ